MNPHHIPLRAHNAPHTRLPLLCRLQQGESTESAMCLWEPCSAQRHLEDAVRDLRMLILIYLQTEQVWNL